MLFGHFAVTFGHGSFDVLMCQHCTMLHAGNGFRFC